MPAFKDATAAVHAGRSRKGGDPPLAGPVFASHFLAPESRTPPYVYGRHGNPTFTAYEEALATLEGGPTYVFSSGMAAIDAVFGSVLQPHDVLVLQSDGYYTVRELAQSYVRSHGIDVRFVPVRALQDPATLAGARLAWLETLSNPGLEPADIAAVAREARARDVLVAVDNTAATPLSTRPLELGADFSISSDSKALTGHGDLILGHVCAADPARAAALLTWRTLHGSVPGPMETFLAHRSLATLHLRLRCASDNARHIAGMLAARPDVDGVWYPALGPPETRAVAQRQMRYFGSLIGFDLGTSERARRFLDRVRIVTEATSFGGVATTAERRARWKCDQVSDGFIRLSVGCEDIDDLVDDITRALGNEDDRAALDTSQGA